MHEEGSKFLVLIGPDVDNLSPIYTVDPWLSEFRDAPPIEIFSDEPIPLAQGTIVRTVCEWDNGRDETLGFPGEMCSTFSYIAGAQDPLTCASGGMVDSINDVLED
jgi:hypothetical protein